jgi:hypothetical protein
MILTMTLTAIPTARDPCPNDPDNDIDGDTHCADVDNCPETYNPDQDDNDNDTFGNACDNCPDNFNFYQEDTDEDGLGDSCDVCPNDPDNDIDGDDVCGDVDNCVNTYNPTQGDYDEDGIGDACDECTDFDDDGYGDPGFPANTCPEDNCPDIANPGQEDGDEDSVGNVCDNCPEIYNPDQADADDDGIGDACEYICGDVNNDDDVNVGDVVFMIAHIFKGGPPPEHPEAWDVNGSCDNDVADAVYLINMIFRFGPPPHCDCPQGSGPGLGYLNDSDTLTTAGCNELIFWVINNNGSPLTITSLTLDWLAPEAYYETITWDEVVVRSGNPALGSGDVGSFSSGQTINGGESVSVVVGQFRANPSGGGPPVDMTGTAFMVDFSDGSSIAFTADLCI